MPNIWFKCKCGTELSIPAEAKGKLIECPGCNESTTVPKPDLEWACTGCGTNLMATADLAGRKMECDNCQAMVLIPCAEQYQPLATKSLKPDANPLIPCNIILSLIRDPKTSELLIMPNSTVVEYQGKDIEVMFNELVQNGIITKEQSQKAIAEITEFKNAYDATLRHSNLRSSMFGQDNKADKIITTQTISVQLLFRLLEIFTSSSMTFIKGKDGESDLIDEMYTCFVIIIYVLWSHFIDSSSHDDKLLHGTMLILPHIKLNQIKQTEMMSGVLATVNTQGVEATAESLCKGGRAEIKGLCDNIETSFTKGMVIYYNSICEYAANLNMSPVTVKFISDSLEQIIPAFAQLDGETSPSDQRYVEHHISVIKKRTDDYTKEFSQGSQENYEAILKELDLLIGMESVKAKVKETANFVKVQQMRKDKGLSPLKTSLHTVYTGKPGTGKTTIARLMGRIYKSLNVLKRGHLIECDRAALVAEYVGQTAPKTNNVIDSALNGILFIDEAYTLAKEGNDFGQEAIDILLKRMEDERDKIIVIIAGYPNEMQKFINSNPGLESRFATYIEFPDFMAEECCKIFASMARKNEMTMTPALKEKIFLFFTIISAKNDPKFSNARFVRNTYEDVLNAQATRIVGLGDVSKDELVKMDAVDLQTENENEINELKAKGLVYLAVCPHCGNEFKWEPELDQKEAVCSKCNKDFVVEFAYRVKE